MNLLKVGAVNAATVADAAVKTTVVDAAVDAMADAAVTTIVEDAVGVVEETGLAIATVIIEPSVRSAMIM